MAIPDFQTLMLPVLRASAAGEVKISEVVTLLGKQLGLSEGELSELLPSGKQTTFANRVNWAKATRFRWEEWETVGGQGRLRSYP